MRSVNYLKTKITAKYIHKSYSYIVKKYTEKSYRKMIYDNKNCHNPILKIRYNNAETQDRRLFR